MCSREISGRGQDDTASDPSNSTYPSAGGLWLMRVYEFLLRLDLRPAVDRSADAGQHHAKLRSQVQLDQHRLVIGGLRILIVRDAGHSRCQVLRHEHEIAAMRLSERLI